MKLSALAVDRAWSFYAEILRVDCKEQCPVAIVQCCVAVKGNCIDCVIVGSGATAEQGSSGGDAECNVALDFDGADFKGACRNEDCSSTVVSACIDRSLQRGRIVGRCISLGAISAYVVNACAKVVDVSTLAGLPLRRFGSACDLCQNHSAGRRKSDFAKPFAPAPFGCFFVLFQEFVSAYPVE